MGSIVLPTSGSVYVDTQILIYTIEIHTTYGPLLEPFWDEVEAKTIEAVTSELALMETLVMPKRTGDMALELEYEQVFLGTDLLVRAITAPILREAARLRAIVPTLRTPDAIHAATALHSGCVMFLSNDTGLKRVPGLPLILLDDVLAA
jgi:predicted nucleic acid-binding protein